MFTALKRIAKSKSDDSVKSARPMPTVLQKRFSQGVQYNMKIIIKGDKCSGKTSLFRRLRGKPLEEQYVPTEGIQVGNVQWSYKNSEEVVKVEVWDVVDKGKTILVGGQNASLDAGFVDVYKGTNGVILIMDVTKNWTFEYVKEEIPKIPKDIPILVMGNRCDMGHHNRIPEDTVRYFIGTVPRPSGTIMYTESSMINGFGLRFVYKFLALPFLHLQRFALECRLARNAEEMQIALQEIDLFQASEDGDYDKFSEQLRLRRRQHAEDLGISLKNQTPKTPSVVFGLGCPINPYTPQPKCSENPRKKLNAKPQNIKTSVEEFVPEEQLDETFFREASPHPRQTADPDECSDSDQDVNPLVAKFQEDVDPNDIQWNPTKNDSSCVNPNKKLDFDGETNLEAFHLASLLNVPGSDEMSTYLDPTRMKSMERKRPDVTKKREKARGGKGEYLETSEVDKSKSSKSQRKQKKFKDENRTSKKKKGAAPSGG